MTIYHYIGYYIGSLIVLVCQFRGDRPSLPNDRASFLEDLQQAGVNYR